MRSVSVRIALGTIIVAAASVFPSTASASAVQTIGLEYQGYSCPPSPTYAGSDVPTTLILTTTANFTSEALFEIPSMGIRTALPFAAGTVIDDVDLGVLAPGTIPYRIDAPPLPDGYGRSCQGTFQVSSNS